ncbi:MAG: hypothetical protein IKQ92_05390 [Clostridia bacterium]|nr:hypothetical protein [Clostridia bacterium]
MKAVLYDYDVYPLVFPAGDPTEITVRPLGQHVKFPENVKVTVHRLDSAAVGDKPIVENRFPFDAPLCGDGCLRFTYTAEAEGELFIRIWSGERKLAQLCVYAVDEDLACRIPFKGDLHMHTCRSDGHEDPGIVAANYRAKGYDFAVITDHHRYYPSLEAMRDYAGAKCPLNILPGEEVHLPQTRVHIVNAGGVFSVNGLFPARDNCKETNGSLDGRRLDETVTPPPFVTDEQYEKELKEIEAGIDDCPENVDLRSYAVCVWAFNKIREAGGLGIFAHPYWIADMWHVPEAFTRYMLEKHPFDAFEVLGGENYYEQNGFQTAIYYDEYRQGRIHPIVGSTDTHGSTEHNRNADICSTIVFAKENTREDLIRSIRDRYSVAVDSISKEYRLVGEFRFQKYASFLVENYFPIHDRAAAVDGEIMRRYYLGEESADMLSCFADKADALIKKYIKTK